MLTEMQRQLLWTTHWPIWLLGGLALLACALIVWLYRLERQVVSRRLGLALTGLRVLVAVLLVAMLARPVLSRVRTTRQQGHLVLLIDTSASMGLADRQATPSERLRLAEALGVPGGQRPYALDRLAPRLRSAGQALAPQAEQLSQLLAAPREVLTEQLAAQRPAIRDAVLAARDALAAGAEQAAAPLRDGVSLDSDVRAQLMDLQARLDEARGRMEAAAGRLQETPSVDAAADVLEHCRRAVATLEEAAPQALALAVALDEACYAQLTEADRQAVDAVAGRSRLEIAASLLRRPSGEDGEPLLERLARQYHLHVYSFDSGVAATSADALPTSAPTADDVQQTDLAGALRRPMTDLAGQRVAAVVVVSDGRHNAGDDPAAAARQLANQGTPVVSLLAGSSVPPTDAAITALEAPDTIYVDDRFTLEAQVKLDGLVGREVRVALLRGEEVADFAVLTPGTAAYRTRVQLGDTVDAPGQHAYRIAIDPQEGEVFPDNNAYPITLSATAERTKLLVIDRVPRWEYRYLKNLFAGRDQSVQLQHVLLAPVGIEDRPPAVPLPASVTNEGHEATALPLTAEEWLKFDVIVLGDVAPEQLGPDALRALERFVGDRGKTLVLIAGPNAMPRAYAGLSFADLLPVTFEAGAPPVHEPYRVALTDEGRASPMLRLAEQDEQAFAPWENLPTQYARAAVTQAKPAAEVLAYALEVAGSGPATTEPASGPAGEDEDRLARWREYVSRRALVVAGQYGLGRVLMLNFDGTWRLRYRTGDMYHHRFWGQVIRWATASRLPAGTSFVRLGTDRTRYAPLSRPVVRARLLGADYAPLPTQQVAVRVLRDGEAVVRLPMRPTGGEGDASGLFEAQLPPLRGGSYRAVLEAPDAQSLLEREGVEEVATDFTVDPSAPAEQIDLAADATLLAALADLTPAGRVLPIDAIADLPDALPEGLYVSREPPAEQALWASWPVLGALLAALTLEWVLRKRAGLA